MDNKISQLIAIAEEFEAIAKKVNQASQERQSNAEECVAYIYISIAIEDEIINELNFVSKENIEQRSRNSMVYNSSRILHSILSRQTALLKILGSKKKLSKALVKSIKSKNSIFDKAVREVISLSQKIIKADNEIILMDRRLLLQKQSQIQSLHELDVINTVSIDDAHKAVLGSSENLKRGLDLVAKINQVPEYAAVKNSDALREILNEAVQGIDTANEVHTRSKAQLEYSQKVMDFTRQLTEHSILVSELAKKKYNIFESNIRNLNLLTEYLNTRYCLYLEVEKIMSDISNDARIDYAVRDMVIYTGIIVEEIKRLAGLTKEMVNIIKINQRANQKSIDLTVNEIEFYNNIKSKVEAMTETTRYPIEGSARNIENGRKIEKNIAEIMKQI